MCIDVSDAQAVQGLFRNEVYHVIGLGDWGRRHPFQQGQNSGAVPQASQGEFADHEGMNALAAVTEERDERRVGLSR